MYANFCLTTSFSLLSRVCEDVMERFTQLVFLSLLFFYNTNYKHLDDPWDREWVMPLIGDISIIYLSEVIVDWYDEWMSKHTLHCPHFFFLLFFQFDPFSPFG